MYDVVDRMRGLDVAKKAPPREFSRPLKKLPPAHPNASIASMRRYVLGLCDYRGIKVRDFFSKARPDRIVKVRNEACYYCRKSGASWNKIAGVMECDHTVAIYRTSAWAVDNNLAQLTKHNAQKHRDRSRARHSKKD